MDLRLTLPANFQPTTLDLPADGRPEGKPRRATAPRSADDVSRGDRVMCSAGGNPLAFWFRFPQLADFLRSLVAGSPSAWLLLCLLFVLLMGWPGRAQRPKTTVEQDGEASKLKELTMHTRQQSSDPVATIGLDIGKNTFHLVGLDKRGAIALRIKYRAASLSADLSICRPALSAWRPALARITSRARSRHSDMTFA